MIRVGLVSFAHVHADGYAWAVKEIERLHGEAMLVAASDSYAARGEPKAREWGVQFFNDYRQMMSTDVVDAVIIASENSRHAEEVTFAAEAGLHVLCEKPVAISIDQLEQMRDAIEHKRIVFHTAFVCRYSPAVVEAKHALESGEFGQIRAISATNHGRYPGGWFGEMELGGGGAIMDHTVHAADVIRMLTNDEFSSVRAFRGTNLRDGLSVEDNALIYARTIRGAIPVSIDCSWSRHDRWPTWGDLQINLVCDKGVIRIDAFKPHINVATREGFKWHSLGEDLNIKLIRAFCQAINEQRGSSMPTCASTLSYVDNPKLRADFDAGAKAAEVAIAAYKSIANASNLVQL